MDALWVRRSSAPHVYGACAYCLEPGDLPFVVRTLNRNFYVPVSDYYFCTEECGKRFILRVQKGRIARAVREGE